MAANLGDQSLVNQSHRWIVAGLQTIRIIVSVAYERIKTEHAGAKNGGGAWMTRDEAKQAAKRQRRQADKAATQIEAQDEVSDEPEMAELPEAWQRLPSGQPVPNWVAALDEARRDR